MSPLTGSGGGPIGLDFGTTNSAVARVLEGRATLATFETSLGPTPTFPSVLYFEKARHPSVARPTSSAGPLAVERYIQAEEKGRFIQSLKAYLADRQFDGTSVLSRRYTLEEMVALIVSHLLSAATASLGAMPGRAVVGRPVHFSNARDDQDDQFAVSRLRSAVERCGFEEIVFEYEPVAAAYSYEQTLGRDELILIGDFGGGTSDFSILHVGPSVRRRGRTRQDILGSDGVAIAGDAFDKQIIRHVVAPRLGLGTEYISPPDKFLPVPVWPYERLERWHHLSFLNTTKNLAMLERVRQHALAPERIAALVHLVTGELGYPLHEAVRRTKFDLSTLDTALFEFQCDPIAISKTVSRDDFERWIAPEVQQMTACVDRLLAATGVAPGQIDRVFLTGGSSFVPAVRRIFIERFGAPKITGGEELTSVATGLALRAAEEWPVARA